MATFQIEKIPNTCIYEDPETGEKSRQEHHYLSLESTPLKTPTSFEPGAINIGFKKSTLKLCWNCNLVVGYAGGK